MKELRNKLTFFSSKHPYSCLFVTTCFLFFLYLQSFIKLESVECMSEDIRERYEELALEIFTRYDFCFTLHHGLIIFLSPFFFFLILTSPVVAHSQRGIFRALHSPQLCVFYTLRCCVCFSAFIILFTTKTKLILLYLLILDSLQRNKHLSMF